MEHLLLHKFQGALIGGNIIYLNSYQLTPNRLIVDASPALISGIDYLSGRDRVESQAYAQQVGIDIASPDRSMVAMLPLMLFFHDDRIKLREILIDVSHAWQLDWETCSSAIAIGYIISRSLTESFNSRTIISQLLDEMNNLHPTLFQSLSTIAELLEQPSSLYQITQRLTTTHPIITPTILAIYCALSTPIDFGSSTRRAYHTKNRWRSLSAKADAIARANAPLPRTERESLLTCALTGMLSGAQNSITGIPLNGDLATQDRAQWLLAAEKLLNAWAGVYHDYSSQPTSTYPLSVAAPRVMQRRT